VLVDVDVVVTPGVQKRVASVGFEFDQGGPAAGPTEADLRRVIGPVEGQPFYAPRIKAKADAITAYYLSLGYEDAAADWREVPQGPQEPSGVDLRFRIHQGPRFLVDRILITGNTHTSARTIEREVTLKPGEPLDFDQIYVSQQRLSALGLFRKVQVAPLQRGAGDQRDVLVTVEEAPATTIGYGAGLEGGNRLRGQVDANGNAVESFDISPSGSFEIGRRNLWGKNRSVTFFSRVGIRKYDTVAATGGGTGTTTNGFREYRILGSFREPRAFGTRADLVLSAYGEQAARSAFNFNRRAARAELSFRLSSTVSTNVRYELEETRLFDQRIAPADQLNVDRAFPQVRLGGFSSSFIRSTRDDELNPSSGTLISLDGKIAAQALGSEVGFAKTFAQLFWFHRIPGPGKVVFASGIRVGLARGFPRLAPARDADDNIILGPDGQQVIVPVEDLPASERFFAGGEYTVRGFGQDRLGTAETLTPTGVPKGGQAVIILNGELRVPLASRIEGVTFLDLGNVWARVSEMDLSALRPGAGFGIRFNSPIGPIRADVGFKLDRQPYANGTSERPIQWYIGVGHAF
jgi:outer membrane protein insertion porin family